MPWSRAAARIRPGSGLRQWQLTAYRGTIPSGWCG